MGAEEDRRVGRTRAALVAAFGKLAMHRRQGKIRVRDVVEEAKVGRSTFYEHFDNAERLYLEALSRPFASVADAAAGQGDPETLVGLLIHFRENRQRVRELFDTPRMREKATSLLADMVAHRLELRECELAIPRRLAALQLAEATLAPVRAWVAGEASCAPDALAQSLCRTGRVLASSLTIDPASSATPPG